VGVTETPDGSVRAETGRERSLQNLRRFQPGESGNPSGHAKGESFAVVLRAELAELRDGRTTRQAIAQKAVQLALKGNLDAIKWIADRTDGKVPDRLEVPQETAELLDDVLRLEILAYAARRRALAGSED